MRHGFSLVELSVVLVILGLLTGGILAGQSLIRASELRSINAELQRYTSAVFTFRDKYMALPGDMTNAQSFWGIAHATPATCGTTASTTALTCNGDGDGNIDSQTSSSTGSSEYFRFWQHLANAGLIEGTYSGVNGPGANEWDSVIGQNIPPSRMSNGGYTAVGSFTADAANAHFEGPYPNRFCFGADRTDNATDGPIITPEEAWNVDTKMDDGKPGYGKVMGRESTATATPGCTTTDVRSTAEWALTATGKLCSLLFLPSW